MAERVPRILVVEDDADVRRTISRVLGNAYDVVEASDGAEALRLALDGGIDLVIHDLRLPAEDPSLTGMRLLYRLHGTLGPGVPVIVISVGDLTEVYEAGLFKAVPKPFTPAPLRNLVSEALHFKQSVGVHADVLGQNTRPWWMPFLGWLSFLGALGIHWQLQAPETVWVPLAAFGVMLVWVGPAPVDAVGAIVKMITKKRN